VQNISLKKNKSNIIIYNEDCIDGLKSLNRQFDVIVTSPPYNLGIKYNSYDDSTDYWEYIEWLRLWLDAAFAALKDDGSLFLNVGSKPSSQRFPFDVWALATDMAKFNNFQLQNTIHWIKSIAIDEVCSVGHYKPINSKRYINDCHEYIYHFTKTGNVELDRLSIGVPYKDKSNAARWGGGDVRCRGNVWFIPYETVQTKKKHPAMFPPKLPEMCMKLHGLARIETVLDPFSGAGNTALACIALEKDFVGFEIDKSYCDMTIEAIEAIY